MIAANHTIVPLDDDLDYAFEELRGYGPEIIQILTGLKALATKQHTADSTQTAIAVLAGNCPNLTSLIALVVAHLGDSNSNPALRDLPADRQDAAREASAQWAWYDEHFAPHSIASETCAVIDGI